MNKLVSQNVARDADCACLRREIMAGKESTPVGNNTKNLRRSKRQPNPEKKTGNMVIGLNNSNNIENESCENSNKYSFASTSEDVESRRQRLRCRHRELNSLSKEINKCDVTTSCDSIRNPEDQNDKDGSQNKSIKGNCPCNRLCRCSAVRSLSSEGSYSRKLNQRKNKKSHVLMEDSTVNSPKLNPIFLWVRQENTKIIEVLCEDYDSRNRLKLKKTHRGWRAIPKTKCFAEAIIPINPKVLPEKTNESLITPKKNKKNKKVKKIIRRKHKKEKVVKSESNSLNTDNVSCDEINKKEDSENNNDKILSQENALQNSNQSSSNNSVEIVCHEANIINNKKPLFKSNSCDELKSFFSEEKAILLPRSPSLDFCFTRDYEDLIYPVNETEEKEESPTSVSLNSTDAVAAEEDESEKIEKSAQNCPQSAIEIQSKEKESVDFEENSTSLLPNVTDLVPDCNDADCDDLEPLLKVIPDLELVEESEMEEMEGNEWSTPTDLTLPKISDGNLPSCTKLSNFSLNISPTVSVTSSVRSPEPLTAPLPEVTITPIPKPAHSQKYQNTYLENLLSSVQSIKHEAGDAMPNGQKSKSLKHSYVSELNSESKNKKLKSEDITLKNLLSKHCTEKLKNSTDFKSCLTNFKDFCEENFSKSSFQDVLAPTNKSDPISQLKEVLSNPLLAVPDPLLVPRARLPALVASPASEIPRLLTMHTEKTLEEKVCSHVTDSDVLAVSLSNLRSLLSSSPEKMASSKYQKSLESFIEWQKYHAEILESQLNSKTQSEGLANNMSDLAAATALGQMLWLPYINQSEVDNQQEFMAFLNLLLSSNYQNNNKLTVPPQINISQVPQPSPFLTPTSPMDIESHLKTLAMWQEVIASHQNSATSQNCPNVPSPFSQDMYRSERNLNHQIKSQFSQSKGSCSLPGSFGGETSHSSFDAIENDYSSARQPSSNSLQKCIEEHQKRLESQHNNFRQESQPVLKKTHKNHGNRTSESVQQHHKKNSSPTISVKPLANLIEKNNYYQLDNSNWDSLAENCELTDQVALRLQQFNTQIRKKKVKEEKGNDWSIQDKKSKREKLNVSTETPKLKVKNLVDPNMSPPKLLKPIDPDSLPILMKEEEEPPQEDGQGQLWHPLFGR